MCIKEGSKSGRREGDKDSKGIKERQKLLWPSSLTGHVPIYEDNFECRHENFRPRGARDLRRPDQYS
jgi:hypothetical protein